MTKNGQITKMFEAHLKQWQEMSDRMQKLVEPVRKQQQQELQKIMQLSLESQAALQRSIEPIFIDLEKWHKFTELLEFTQYALPDLVLVAEQTEKFKRSFEEIINPDFEELSRTQEVLILLGMHGWYIDLEMPVPSLWDLKKALEEENKQDVEGSLIQYFEERLDEIEASIIRKFPTREKIIRAAFSAHRRCEYELSIPVFLSQTDGICKEISKECFFMKKDKKPRTAIYVEQIAADTYWAALLSPLAHSLPIGVSENERDAGFSELNRHMVLHGESLDYGTKTNSLKTISLINYVAHVLKIL